MPFQSEKQRRYLHANHPEIAKRWEEEYATGGISNHFRKKFKKGSYSRSYNPGAGGVVQHGPVKTHHGGGGGGGGGGGPKPHSGPTAAEIAAAKAAAAAAAKAAAEAKHKKWLGEQHTKKTKKAKHLKNLNKNKNWLWRGDTKGKEFYKNVDLKKAWDMEKKWGYNPNYKGPGAINIGKNPNILDKGIGFGKYLSKAFNPKAGNISGGTPLMRTIAMQPFKIAARAVPVVGAAVTAYDIANAYKGFVEKDLARKAADPEAYAAEQEEQMGMSAAEGGIANHFKFKDGGTPRRRYFTGAYGGGNPHEDRAAEESHANEFAGIDSGGWDPGVASPGTTSSGGNVNTGGDQEDDVAQMMHNMGITPDHSPDYTGSDLGWVVSEDEETEIGGADYIGHRDKVRIHNEILNRKTTWDKNKWKRDAVTIGGLFLSPPTSIFGAYSFIKKQEQKKKERIAEIDADLALLDKIGATKYTPHTETLYQKLEQEKLDLIQPRSTKDEDTGGDGPTPLVVPAVMDEMASATGEIDMFDAWDRIKRNQAIFAARQSADDTKVGEWVGDQRLLVNSGGLANLFRVKNRN